MKNNLFWTGFFALVSVFRERKLPMAEKKELAVTEEKVVEIEMERLRSFGNARGKELQNLFMRR